MDDFDITQFLGDLPPLSPGTAALFDTQFAFGNMEEVNTEQAAEHTDTLADQSWMELLNGCSMETTEPTVGVENFGDTVNPNLIQQLEPYVPEYTITNAQIDPALLTDADFPPQETHYISSSPVQSYDDNIFALSEVNISPSEPAPVYQQVDTSDFFQSTATVPRLALNGSYRVEHDKKTGAGHEYSLYLPLPAWYPPGIPNGITYNDRGFLRKDIKFTSSTLTSFLRYHPLRTSLTLRIEKHPYEIKARFSGRNKPKYTCCRSLTCALGENFKVGDLRVAIDELTSRFSPQHVQNADPYFASGYLHLQCLDALVDLAPLVACGVLVPDTRKTLPHEPASAKGEKGNNKMGLNNKELAAFAAWKIAAAAATGQLTGSQSLTAKIWLANCKKSRSKNLSRAPPGVTKEDVEAQSQVHALWGGRRAVGKSIEEMYRLEAEGRLDELIAPRNGTTRKRGMGPTGATAQRNKKRWGIAGTKRKSAGSSSPDPNMKRVTSPSQNVSPPRKDTAGSGPPPKKARTEVVVHEDLNDYSYLLAPLPPTPSGSKTKITLGMGIIEPLREISGATRLTLPRKAHNRVINYEEPMDLDEDKENVDPWEQVSPFGDESPYEQWV